MFWILFEGKQVESSDTNKKSRTPIKSLIYGVVVKLGEQKDHYGRHLVVSDGNNCLYLLGHLYDYEDGIQVGTRVYPEMIVGYVGNTGNCISKIPKSQGGGTHLHVSVYVSDEAKNIAEADNIQKPIKLNSLLWSGDNYLTIGEGFKLVNSFDHTDIYKETL